MAALCDPVEDAIFSGMEKLSEAGYEFEDITLFGLWLFELLDNHPRCKLCVMDLVNAYSGRLPEVD